MARGKVLIMNDVQRVALSSELSVGEEIEAWHQGRLFHRGTVSRTIPSTDLFWITESKTGTRRLIDLEALVVLRLPKTAPVKAVLPHARDGHAPALRIPLFQEPGMAAR